MSFKTSTQTLGTTFKEVSQSFNEIPKTFTEMTHKGTVADWTTTVSIGVTKALGGTDEVVINDIRLYSIPLNTANWETSLSPYGYGNWRKLVTGDYGYSKALCKFVLRAEADASRPNIRLFKHKVDVPDVIDHGVVEIPLEQPFKVNFSKGRNFHIIPDVNAIVKSAEGVVELPQVTVYGVTEEGFNVTLKVGEQFVAGKISYSARGY